jgi:DNA replication protein DnaC
MVILFSIFWRDYPRRIGRIKAERCWNKLSEDERGQALYGLQLWKQTDQWHQGDGQFIPYASTFLAQKRYLDEPWTGAFGQQRAEEGL